MEKETTAKRDHPRLTLRIAGGPAWRTDTASRSPGPRRVASKRKGAARGKSVTGKDEKNYRGHLPGGS
jgi:hypothetical protein